MLVHRRVTPSIKFAGTHLYTWVERGTVRVKCLAQEHNTMSLARAQTRTARSGDERTNHEAIAPPTWLLVDMEYLFLCSYMLFAGWEVPVVRNCDRGLVNAAGGLWPRTAFSILRSQFFTIQTNPKPANNSFIFFPAVNWFYKLQMGLLCSSCH